MSREGRIVTGRSPVNRHSMIILTYYRHRKKEPLIALGSHEGGGGGGDLVRFEHPCFVEVVPNCLVTFLKRINKTKQKHDHC